MNKNNYIFDIIELKNKNIIRILVEVPLYDPQKFDDKVKIRTTELIKILKKLGVKHGKCLRSCVVHNISNETRKGSWIFEYIDEQVKKPSSRTKHT